MRTWIFHFAVVTVAFAATEGRFLGGADCNQNGIDDFQDIESGASDDCNGNDLPDECDLAPGNITFELPRWAAREIFSSIVVQDLDGDSDIDVAGAGYGILVLINDGVGNFAPVERYSVTEEPWNHMIGADLDVDGDLDLVVVDGWVADMPVLLNRGDGTFEVFTYSLLEGGSRSLVAEDLDGDGDLDLAMVRWDPRYEIHPGISIFRQLDDGSFAGPEVFPTDAWGGSLTAFDADADGDIDLAWRVFRGIDNEPAAKVAVLFNRGDGTFANETSYSVVATPSQLAAEDLDGDGDMDLVTVNSTNENVSVFVNRGDGTFDDRVDFTSGGAHKRLLAADGDSDGDVDLVSAGRTDREAPGSLSVILNRGAASFAAPSLYEFEGEPRQPFLADVNGDGGLEILAPLSRSRTDEAVAILRRFAGDFESAGEVRVGHGADTIAPRDVDGDGDVDLVSNGVSVILNATNQELTVGCAEFLRGDVNADGVVSASDMVALRRYLFNGTLFHCEDAGDVLDNEQVDLSDALALVKVLFLSPDWPTLIPEPFPSPSRDPTLVGVKNEELTRLDPDPDARVNCSEYHVEPAQESDDVLRIGDVVAIPGGSVRIPIYLSTAVSVDALQLVLDYDSELLTLGSDALSFEGSFFEHFPIDEGTPPVPRLAVLTPHPGFGVVTVLIAGDLVYEGFEVTPGEDILIAWIEAQVSADASPDSVVTLSLTNGANGEGVGPYRLRNELTHKGEARFVSLLPRLVAGQFQIVGDQSLFRRGDCNGDGDVAGVSDAIFLLTHNFLGGIEIPCAAACDVNGDGETNGVTDAIALLTRNFVGGVVIPHPFPYCGVSGVGTFAADRSLGCAKPSPCP